jgi:acyl-CoA synthetase (NDP forming)
MAADRCDEAGLEVPVLSPDLQSRVARRVPRFGAVANPVDVTAQVLGDTSAVGMLCRELAESDEVDAVLTIVSMVTGAQADALASDLAVAAIASPKPIVVAWLAGEEHTAGPRAVMRRQRQPSFRSIKEAVTVLRQLRRRPVAGGDTYVPRNCPDPTQLLPAGGHLTIAEGHCLDLLDTFGIRRPPGRLVHSPEDATAAVDELGGRAVLKLQSGDVPHKTDVGAVRLDVPTKAAATVFAELAALGERLKADTPRDVLVQQMAPSGIDLLVGIVASDDGFPPVLSLGWGGVDADLHPDRACALLPLAPSAAAQLIEALPAARILDGYRGGPAYDRAALADLLVRLSDLAAALGERLAEVEINPVRVYPLGAGVHALDFLLRLCPSESPEGTRATAEADEVGF